ncbi:hypothetical protein CR513_24001, partial [Mucuna pruriens]
MNRAKGTSSGSGATVVILNEAFDLGLFLVQPSLCREGFRYTLEEETTSTVMSITVGSSILAVFFPGLKFVTSNLPGRVKSKGHLVELPRLVFVITLLGESRLGFEPLYSPGAESGVPGSEDLFKGLPTHVWDDLFESEPVPLAVMPKSMVLAGVPSRSTEHYEEWVSPNVLKHVSKVKPSEVDRLVVKGAWVDPSSANDFIMQAPFDNECVCHAALEDEDDFIFMYDTVFEDLGISMPFDFFYAEVLGMLGIPPSQLHPNSWVVLGAFETSGCHLGVSRDHALHEFISPLHGVFQGFKTRYIKIVPIKGASLTMDGEPIPWYLRIPNQVQGMSLEDLNAGDQVSWGILNRLPHGVNCKEVVVPGSVLKPVLTSPPSPGPKRKGASSLRQDDIKRAKAIEAATEVVHSSKVEAAFEGASPMSTDQGVAAVVTIVDSSTPLSVEFAGPVSLSTNKGDIDTIVGPSEVDSLWGLQLDSPSLKLGMKLAACDRESLLAAGPGKFS